MNHQITIEILKGGFVLNYPELTTDDKVSYVREVFNSPRKLDLKLREVVKALSLVSE